MSSPSARKLAVAAAAAPRFASRVVRRTRRTGRPTDRTAVVARVATSDLVLSILEAAVDCGRDAATRRAVVPTPRRRSLTFRVLPAATVFAAGLTTGVNRHALAQRGRRWCRETRDPRHPLWKHLPDLKPVETPQSA